MKEIGAQVLVKTVKGLVDGTLKEKPQLAIGNKQLTTDITDATGSRLKHAPQNIQRDL